MLKLDGKPISIQEYQKRTRDKTEVNSDPIFTHKDYKKKTKGYDKITGEIEKRGKPQEDAIFIKNPKDEPTPDEIAKMRKKKEKKKLEAYNKKLYRDRLKQKWDRAW